MPLLTAFARKPPPAQTSGAVQTPDMAFPNSMMPSK